MDPEVWRWIWLAAAAMFVVGEIAMTGAFFLLPFGVGATAATAIAFTGADPVWQWLAFVLVSVASFGAMRPMARRMERGDNPVGVGAGRLVGETGVVVTDLSPDPERSASAARNGTPKPPKATTYPPEPPSGWS
jgi:membrane protein implicated in regulation of membrane protease activity